MSTTTPGIQPRRVDVIHAAPKFASPLESRGHSLWPCLAPALASAALLWMSFFPLAWGWLGWVALAPFLALTRARATPRRLYLCAWLCGSAFFWPALLWMPVNPHMYAAWALLAVYCSLYFPAALYLIRLLDRGTFLPLVVSVPLVWIALEFCRSFLLTGFAWYYLGHTQHTFLSLIQIADLGGVYLVSALVAAVNAWIFALLYQMPRLRDLCRWEEPEARGAGPRDSLRSSRGLIYQAGMILLAFLGTLIYGGWRLGQTGFERGPVVSLLQTSISQNIRDAAADEDKRTDVIVGVTRQIAALCKRAIDHHPRSELIIWPETSYPSLWLVSPRDVPVNRIPQDFRRAEYETRQHLLRELLPACPANHLLGMNSVVLDENLKEHRYNSAILLEKDGRFAQRYDKLHRVPFGEYVPLRGIVPFVDLVAPYDFDYSIEAGTACTRFVHGKHTFGVLVCYEDTDPFLARRYVRDEDDGPPVDFLVNMSNDGWFEGASEHDEHLAISRFRAIECRRALLRSVNMGISAVIDGNGRVLAPQAQPGDEAVKMWLVRDEAEDLPVSEWHEYKKTVGVVRAQVPIDTRSSFYARSGDWFAGGCLVLVGVGCGWSIWRRGDGRGERAASTP